MTEEQRLDEIINRTIDESSAREISATSIADEIMNRIDPTHASNPLIFAGAREEFRQRAEKILKARFGPDNYEDSDDPELLREQARKLEAEARQVETYWKRKKEL